MRRRIFLLVAVLALVAGLFSYRAWSANNCIYYGSGQCDATFQFDPATKALAVTSITYGVAGTTTGSAVLSGSTSGVVTIQPQAVAGTYNFNLPTAAGTSGQPLLSGGGAAAAQTYGTLGVAAGGTGLVQTASQQITTNGTAVTNGTCQAQPAATITGVTTTSACYVSVPTALPATWQTGIVQEMVVTSNTATVSLCNPTAGAITPAATAINIKCIL